MENVEHQGSARVWDEPGKDRYEPSRRPVKDKILGASGQAKKKLAAAKLATTAKAQEYRVGIEKKIQAHPLKAVGYALGAGAVLGLLLRTRARRR
jgi:ElaB/YqjD/DUF883 family membrane-anchored ribosome-binding protein